MLRTLRRPTGLVYALTAAGLALSLTSGSVLASVTVTFNGWSPDGYKTITENGTVAGYSGADTVNLDTSAPNPTPAGIGSINESGLAGADALTGLIAAQTVQAYCVDLFHTIGIGSQVTYTYNGQVSASNSVASGGDVISGPSNDTMYRWTQKQINELAELLQASQNVTDGSATAAFQIAIWEVAYDQGLSPTLNSGVSSGDASNPNNTAMNFSNGISFTGLTPTIAADAETDYQNAINAANTVPPSTEQVWELSNENIAANSAQTGATTPQTLIYLVVTSGIGGQSPGAPEPGTVGILGAGLAALWVAARRQRSA